MHKPQLRYRNENKYTQAQFITEYNLGREEQFIS